MSKDHRRDHAVGGVVGGSTEFVSQKLLQKLAMAKRDDATNRHQETVAEALYAWRADTLKAMAALADSRDDSDIDRLGDLQADLLRIGLLFTAFNADADMIGIIHNIE